MDPLRTSGALWLVAALASAAVTLGFRDVDAWYLVTLVAGAVAAAIGVLLLRRPSSTVALSSAVAGIAWVLMYVILVAVQSDDVPAWSADAIVGVIGAAAALVARGPGRQTTR